MLQVISSFLKTFFPSKKKCGGERDRFAFRLTFSAIRLGYVSAGLLVGSRSQNGLDDLKTQ